MTVEMVRLFVILVVALVLFSTERIPVDVTALGVLLALILTGLLPAEAAFAGFGSSTIILLLSLFILTAALIRTGVVDLVGQLILRRTGTNPKRLLATVTTVSAGLGAFISNTASTAFFVPIVLRLAQRAQFSASKLLMPLAFSSILSSSVTLVSTSTNIVVSGLLTQAGLPPMGMFELAPVGIPITIAGLIYLLTIGRRLLPDRSSANDAGDEFGSRVYLTEALILPESPLVGKTLAESNLSADFDLTLLRIIRNKRRYLAPRADTELHADDVLLVEGQREEILRIKDAAGVEIKADVKLSDPDLQTEDVRLVEAVLVPPSPLIGRTLKGYRFRDRWGLQVLAINRRGQTIDRKISLIPLRLGDILLVQGHRDHIARCQNNSTFSVLTTVDESRPNLGRAPIAVGIFGAALLAAALNLLALPVAMLLGVLAIFLTRCIHPNEAYRQVEWDALILIGSMLAVGRAMESTGAARFLAAQIVNQIGHIGPVGLLTAFFILAIVMTQPMSNQAAAIVLVPIAIQTATQLELNARTFAMMIAVAASCSYLTPLEPSCLMVYGPGRYRFTDFLKVGSLLTLLIYLIAIVLVPIIWPL
ncbi:MAG TPA: SLC13 family permease [Anaerolineae bacterium]|nr:SLC13 family permease [Anaerolineae bacterium]